MKETSNPILTTVELASDMHLPYSDIQMHPYLWENFLYTLCFLILFAYIRLKGRNLFNHLLHALVQRKKAEIFLNEGIYSDLICHVLALTLSCSVLAGCISLLLHERFIVTQTLYYFLALMLYHFLLIAIVRIFGWTFHAKSLTQEIIIHLWIFHSSMGILISPLVLSTFYVQPFAIPALFKIVIFSLGLLIIVKSLRWVEILYAYKVSILYMILYLCALEIVPLLFLYKVVL